MTLGHLWQMPKAYIKCLRDEFLLPVHQDAMHDRLREGALKFELWGCALGLEGLLGHKGVSIERIGPLWAQPISDCDSIICPSPPLLALDPRSPTIIAVQTAV